MIIRTRVFDIANSRFQNLAELAGAMKISPWINPAWIRFSDLRLDELFYFNGDEPSQKAIATPFTSKRYHHIIERFNGH